MCWPFRGLSPSLQFSVPQSIALLYERSEEDQQVSRAHGPPQTEVDSVIDALLIVTNQQDKSRSEAAHFARLTEGSGARIAKAWRQFISADNASAIMCWTLPMCITTVRLSPYHSQRSPKFPRHHAETPLLHILAALIMSSGEPSHKVLSRESLQCAQTYDIVNAPCSLVLQ